MNSKQNNQLFRINKRPRDALSDNEDDQKIDNQYVQSCNGCGFPDMPQDGRKFCSNNCKQSPSYNDIDTKYNDGSDMDTKYTEDNETKEPESPESMSIWIWLEYPVGHHYLGCFGQQSYSYAKNPNDIIVAYNYENMDKDWFLWLLKITSLSPSQFLWIQNKSHPTFDDMQNDEYLLKQIALIIEQKLTENPSLQIRLMPFMMWAETRNTINKIKSNIAIKYRDNIITCCADYKWAKDFANKACLHRYISKVDKPSLFEERGIYSDIDGLTECKGFVCKNKEELLMAYDKLGKTNVVIKDCYGASGDDISFYKSKQEIIDNFRWKSEFKLIEMEEDLRYNESGIANVEFISSHFYDNEVIGIADQIIIDNAEFGGTTTYKNKEIEKDLIRMSSEVMKRIGTKYMGGFDFVVQSFEDKNIKPKVYLIDMNTARYTATTQTFIFMKKFGISDKYFIRKTLKIKQSVTFRRILKENRDVLFDKESKVGAYFNMFHPAAKDSVVSIIGNDEQDANQRYKILQSIEYLKL